MHFRKLCTASLLAIFASAASLPAHANPMVGGAPMYATKNIVENAVNSKDHTTLVAAVKAAGLVDTLEGPGPFTVFAPTNAAFAALPAGTVDMLLKPENKAKLQKILTCHVVPGKLSGSELVKMATGPSAACTRCALPAATRCVAEVKARTSISPTRTAIAANVTIADVNQSNGVIHVVNKVLVPK